jgi:hypothetical protein
VTEFFLDTSFAIALSTTTDQHHSRALELADQIENQEINLITTQAILLEIGNALSKQKYRVLAAQLLESLILDPSVEVISLSEELYQSAFYLFKSRPDKEWGLVDCVSFVVMNDRAISSALIADKHFSQAGFIALLNH